MAWITHCDQCGKQEQVDNAFAHRHETFWHLIPPSKEGEERYDLDFCGILCLYSWLKEERKRELNDQGRTG